MLVEKIVFLDNFDVSASLKGMSTIMVSGISIPWVYASIVYLELLDLSLTIGGVRDCRVAVFPPNLVTILAYYFVAACAELSCSYFTCTRLESGNNKIGVSSASSYKVGTRL